MITFKKPKHAILSFLGLILFVSMIFGRNLTAQPSCEWDGSGDCCGKIVPCNGGTYPWMGNECKGIIVADISMCPY